MFTGLIEEVGRLRQRVPRGGSVELSIEAPLSAGKLHLGDSVAVDGCCLTVESREGDRFVVFASPETMQRTSLAERSLGSGVNIETSLTLSKPLGGHLVQGHVDGVGRLVRYERQGEAWDLEVELSEELARYCVPKGSIAIDGISLTIARLEGNRVTVAIIPATHDATNLRDRRPGDPMNIETDIVGKYVYRFLERTQAEDTPPNTSVSLDLLRRAGFPGA